MLRLNTSALARFHSKVVVSSGCWPWRGCTNARGYGLFSLGRKSRLAHRVAFVIAYPEVRLGKRCVLHRCDNPPCVNPFHLFTGTRLDNARDMRSKGRGEGECKAHQKGEIHWKAKLTVAAVRDIRQLFQAGVLKRDIAAKYSVTRQAIHHVVTGKMWRHVQQDEVMAVVEGLTLG